MTNENSAKSNDTEDTVLALVILKSVYGIIRWLNLLFDKVVISTRQTCGTFKKSTELLRRAGRKSHFISSRN